MKLNQEQRDKIIELFYTGRTQKSLAEEFGVCTNTIRKILSSNGVEKSRCIQVTMDNELRQLLIGSLLGDGSFVSPGGRTINYYLSIAHAVKQKEYLKYKLSILSKHNLASKIIESTSIDRRFKEPKYTECRVKTRLHPIFTEIRNKYYDETGHKRVKYDFVKDIDALGLAIWYMDDGYVTKNSCIFSSCSFTLDEQQILADILLEKFGLHFNLGKNDNSMYLHAVDFPKFVEIIRPYVINEMQYKLIPYSKRVLNKSNELLESCDADQQPSQPLTKLDGSETNS